MKRCDAPSKAVGASSSSMAGEVIQMFEEGVGGGLCLCESLAPFGVGRKPEGLLPLDEGSTASVFSVGRMNGSLRYVPGCDWDLVPPVGEGSLSLRLILFMPTSGSRELLLPLLLSVTLMRGRRGAPLPSKKLL